MIKSEFTFFQVQSKGTFADASELIEPPFSDGPEVLDPINVISSISKFIVSMLDTIVLLITKVYQAVIGLKSIRIDRRAEIDLLPYNGHQRALRAIPDNLGIHFTASLDQPENDVFAFGPAASDSTNPAGSEVANVKRTLLLAVFSNPYSDFTKNRVNRLPRKTGQFSNFGGFNIQSKQPHNLSKYGLRNS